MRVEKGTDLPTPRPPILQGSVTRVSTIHQLLSRQIIAQLPKLQVRNRPRSSPGCRKGSPRAGSQRVCELLLSKCENCVELSILLKNKIQGTTETKKNDSLSPPCSSSQQQKAVFAGRHKARLENKPVKDRVWEKKYLKQIQ